jgi:hypothetical protein
MRITSGGNVGIGTTTIGSKLQVNGNAAIGYSASTAAPTNGLAVAGKITGGGEIDLIGSGATGITMTSSASQAFINLRSVNTAGFEPLIGFGTTSAGNMAQLLGIIGGGLRVTTASVERLRITSGGNVGIGTTSPFSLLQVTSGTSMTTTGGDQASNATIEGANVAIGAAFTSQLAVLSNSSIAADIGGGIAFGSKYSGNAFAYYAAIKTGKHDATSGNYGGYLQFATRANGGDVTERMRITSGGDVGIGTTSPTSKLHVQGTSYFFDQAIFGDKVGIGTTTPGSTLQVNGNAAIGYSASTAGPTNGLAVSGDVSIGTNTANSKLHVAGSLRLPITTKTATYTLDATDYTVVFDLNGNATANLPDATTIPGRIYVIKINRTNVGDTLTIDPNGAQTIDGFATYDLLCQQAITIQSDGSNWRIIGDFAAGLNCL